VDRKATRKWLLAVASHRTRQVCSLLFALFFGLSAVSLRSGQKDDPSEIFLKAYLSAQRGAKLERENRFKTALAKYRFAGSLIEELRKSYANWQPAIVGYRGRKISEGILRIQERMSRQNDLATTAKRLPEIVPSLPETDGAWSEPGPEAVAPPAGGTIAQGSSDAAIKEATRKLRSRVDELQNALEKSRSNLETARKEKQLVDARLKKKASELGQARNQIEESRKSERQARDQLAKVEDSLKSLEASRDNGAREEQQLRAEIARLKDAVAASEEARVTAEKQRDETNTRFAEASKQIATLSQQRDEALVQLHAIKEADQRLQAVLAENSDLKEKLANAEKHVREFSEDAPKTADQLVAVKREVGQLQQQLAETQKQNQYFAARVGELHVQLDEANVQLQSAKPAGANNEEAAHLAKENELLRNIVVRERQEEARRYQVKERMLAELDKLKIKSDALNRQIELLAQPVTRLSNEELALLREPVVSISNQNTGILKASFVFAKKSAPNFSEMGGADAREKSAGNGDRGKPDGSSEATGASDSQAEVPNDLLDLARAAKKSLDQAKYRTAEKQFREILAKSPKNLYALSNLAVVYLRIGKFRAAESTLKEALTISANDEFLRTTLGIVYYRQSKFDDALAELTQAVEINPKSAAARNYLGITASQKGRPQEAEKEILQAIANNPDYADAHFNLAVILATTQPASKELAKRHYARATALGTQPDPSLEKLLQ
jgi:Flp pilus assembly protein TadD/septal ring factor EnvC (AmiA/AmiB activator)